MDLLLGANPLASSDATTPYANPNEALQRQTALIQLRLPDNLFTNETFSDSPQSSVDVSIGSMGEVSVRGRAYAGESMTDAAQARSVVRSSGTLGDAVRRVPPIVWLGLAAFLLLKK